MPIGRGSTQARADKVIDSTVVEGNLVKIKTPKFITMVNAPANQTGFKIVRSTEGETKMQGAIVRRTRRSTETSPVLRLTFPAGTEEATVTEALTSYGMKEYRVEQADGVYTATRADLKSISKDATTEIKLTEAGLMATVARQEASVEAPEEKPNLSMPVIEFDASKFTLEEVQRWVAEKCVDGGYQEPQNAGKCYVVRRSEVPENEETRLMVLEDGVTATVVRSEVMLVPAGYIAVVSETAYGNWGWGQLDFAAKMADEAFCEQMDLAIDSLRSVLNRIVIYSSLPLDVRKELAMRALGQFGDYIGTVMDSLPRQLLVSVIRSATPQLEKPMTQANSGANTQAAPAQEEKPITRAELAQLVTEGIAAAMKALPAPVARAEGAAAEPATPAKTETTAAAALTRADVASALAEAMTPVVDGLKALAGATIVRGAPEAVPGTVKEAKRDVFDGAFGLSKPKK